MVHLSNIQMSAASTKHKLKSTNYDIDGFVSQLFASTRFVELVIKLSEEVAKRIKYNYNKKSYVVSSDIHEVYNEKGTKRRSKGKKYDIDGFINQVLASKNFHELLAEFTVNAASKIMRANENSELRTRTENSHENLPKTNQGNNTKMKEELTGKIDIQAIIKEMLSLSENLKHKYDDDESDTNRKLQSKEETTGSVNKDQISKTLRSTSIYNVTETNKNDSNKKTSDLTKRSQDDMRGHYGKADHERYSESSHSGHSGTDGEDQENSKKNYNSLEVQGSSQENRNSREAQNSKLKAKGIVKQKTINHSSLNKKRHNPPSEEKINREVEETKEETENRNTENIVVNVGNEDSVQNNKMVSDYNPYGEVQSSKGFEDSGDRRSPERPQERSLEDQRSKEPSDEGQFKPIIRNEGGKQYTYVQDPDYDEYNEKMAKWRKRHPENASDFIM